MSVYIVSEIVEILEDYTGADLPHDKVWVVSDPGCPDTYAVKVPGWGEYLVMPEAAEGENVEEVEFKKWPPDGSEA